MRAISSHTQIPVAVCDLHKSYGTLPVLEGIDLDFRSGETTAVVGPNGAGKTTLIKAMLGLVRPDRGSVRVFGADVQADPECREYIGYVPQAAAFPENLTGERLIELLRTIRGRGGRDRELCRAFELDGELRKPVRTLSGGTRQKLSAVLALMFDPAVLILDEPTAGLDPLASATLKDLLAERAAAGASVLLTSHVMADLETMCDRVVFLMDGHVRFQGPLSELRTEAGESQLERAIASLLRRRAG